MDDLVGVERCCCRAGFGIRREEALRRGRRVRRPRTLGVQAACRSTRCRRGASLSKLPFLPVSRTFAEHLTFLLPRRMRLLMQLLICRSIALVWGAATCCADLRSARGETSLRVQPRPRPSAVTSWHAILTRLHLYLRALKGQPRPSRCVRRPVSCQRAANGLARSN